MRVLAGGPARKTVGRLFDAHLAGLHTQSRPGMDVVVRHDVVSDPGGPRWHGDKIGRVAECRQRFVDASRASASALFMVDTDVILGPGVLERLWAVEADVVYGVFWTRANWGGSLDRWPQVWDINPYGWTQECADALHLDGVHEVEVYGGGACTLIRGRGFESRYYPLLESIKPYKNMWAGEDRSYCLGLEARGVRQVAVTGLPIQHLYDVTMHTRPAVRRAMREVGLEA